MTEVIVAVDALQRRPRRLACLVVDRFNRGPQLAQLRHIRHRDSESLMPARDEADNVAERRLARRHAFGERRVYLGRDAAERFGIVGERLLGANRLERERPAVANSGDELLRKGDVPGGWLVAVGVRAVRVNPRGRQ